MQFFAKFRNTFALFGRLKDLISPDEQQEVLAAAQTRFPGKQILLQNSLDSFEITPWLNAVTLINSTRPFPDFKVDYWTYKDGEREMAWLDHSFTISSNSPEICRAALMEMIDSILKSVQEENCMVGHLKFFVDAHPRAVKFGFTTADFLLRPLSSSWRTTLNQMTSSKMDVMINARISVRADHFQQIVFRAIESIEEHLIVNIHPLSGDAFNPEMSLDQPC